MGGFKLRAHYEEDFKIQLVQIYNQGSHTYRELSEKYGVAISTIRDWVVKYNKSKSFNVDDNRTEEEKEIINPLLEYYIALRII